MVVDVLDSPAFALPLLVDRVIALQHVALQVRMSCFNACVVAFEVTDEYSLIEHKLTH